MSDIVLDVERLEKTFRKPFTGTKVHAVRGVSFQVRRGEVFGFLGPNGAGKTTTLKMIAGLIAPTGGRARILGREVPSPEAMQRVGFLPENPYVYPHLTPREFVSLCGRLNGMGGAALRDAVERLIARAGIGYAIDRPTRALSKGMLQRTGLAAALVHGPELLVLDEPMSGLDPVGRKEVRDLLVEEAEAGRTVFFSSHVLADVELLCDRVCILKRGEVVVYGSLDELLTDTSRAFEVTLSQAEGLAASLDGAPYELRRTGTTWMCEVHGDAPLREVLERAWAAGARVDAVVPKRETLEALFVRRAL